MVDVVLPLAFGGQRSQSAAAIARPMHKALDDARAQAALAGAELHEL